MPILSRVLTGSTAQAPGATTPRDKVFLVDDLSVPGSVYVDVTGLSFPVVPGRRYAFEAWGAYASTSTTNGAFFSCNGPAFVSLAYESLVPRNPSVPDPYFGNSYDAPPAAPTTAYLTGNHWAIRGVVSPSAPGIFAIRVINEQRLGVGVITVKAGAVLYWGDDL